MRNVRRFQLDELLLRPGTYFNPQTEIMVVVDDSPEVDNEIFEAAGVEASDWVLISEETPMDEHQRDDLIERFQQSHREGGELSDDDEDDEDEDEDLDEDDLADDEDEEQEDLGGVDDLEFERE